MPGSNGVVRRGCESGSAVMFVSWSRPHISDRSGHILVDASIRFWRLRLGAGFYDPCDRELRRLELGVRGGVQSRHEFVS